MLLYVVLQVCSPGSRSPLLVDRPEEQTRCGKSLERRFPTVPLPSSRLSPWTGLCGGCCSAIYHRSRT
nr:MAG TPA: hypothetical protein [Caudoviricetes sp.]